MAEGRDRLQQMGTGGSRWGQVVEGRDRKKQLGCVAARKDSWQQVGASGSR